MQKRTFGVTLIEMIVAIAVFAIGMGTIFTVFPSGFAVAQKDKNLSTAYELAVGCLEKCREYDLFGGSTYDSSGTTYGKTDREYFGKRDAPSPSGTVGGLMNTKGNFVRCDKILDVKGGNSNPESFYFYKMDFVPVVDKARLYAEYPHERKGGDGIHGINVDLGQEGFASMYRVTCTVRGPYPPGSSGSDAFDEKFLEENGAVEAILSTMIANDRMGDALLAETKYIRKGMNKDAVAGSNSYESRGTVSLGEPYVDDTGDSDGDGKSNCHNGYFIRIKKLVHRVRPEDFTCFMPAALNNLELFDTGPTVVAGYVTPNSSVTVPTTTNTDYDLLIRYYYVYNYAKKRYGSFADSNLKNMPGFESYTHITHRGNAAGTISQNQTWVNATNILGLDNVVIYCPRRVLRDGTNNTDYSHGKCSFANGGWVAESNKIIRMYPPNSAGNNSQHWRFDLLNNLIARDNDYQIKNPKDSWGRDRYRQGLLMDQVFDGDCIVYKDGEEYAGYPAGSYVSGQVKGTRVRSLVTINGGGLDSFEYYDGDTKKTVVNY